MFSGQMRNVHRAKWIHGAETDRMFPAVGNEHYRGSMIPTTGTRKGRPGGENFGVGGHYEDGNRPLETSKLSAWPFKMQCPVEWQLPAPLEQRANTGNCAVSICSSGNQETWGTRGLLNINNHTIINSL